MINFMHLYKYINVISICFENFHGLLDIYIP